MHKVISVTDMIQIYRISKHWFDVPIITVLLCIVGTVVVIRKRKQIIGFAVRTGKYLHYIAVSKEYQGKGYGHKLFSKIEPHIKSLNVKTKLRKAINFYKAYGFRIKKSEHWITGKRYLMVKG